MDIASDGGRKPRVTDEELLTVFDEASDPVLTTSEVAERVPIGKRGVLKRLERLADEGQLMRKDVGARAQVWWHEKE